MTDPQAARETPCKASGISGEAFDICSEHGGRIDVARSGCDRRDVAARETLRPDPLTIRELLVDLLDYSDGHGGRPMRQANEQRFVIDTWSLTARGQQFAALRAATPDPAEPMRCGRCGESVVVRHWDYPRRVADHVATLARSEGSGG